LLQSPLDLLLAGPEVAQEHGTTLLTAAKRLGFEINVDSSGEREGHDKRWRHEIIRSHFRVYPSFEVAVTRQRRGDDQVPAPYLLGNFGGEGPELPIQVAQP
jgi:hypothetical protein